MFIHNWIGIIVDLKHYRKDKWNLNTIGNFDGSPSPSKYLVIMEL